VRVVVEKIGNRVHVRSPFEYKDRVKAIGGGRWNPTAKSWTFAVDLEVCRLLREEFKDELEIGPELWSWAANQVSRERAATTMLRASGVKYDEKSVSPPTRVRELAPKMLAGLKGKPFQVPGARFLAYARQALIADEPGMGKTIQTLAALVENLTNGGRVLVLCPKTAVTSVWREEVHKWLDGFEQGFTVTILSGLSPVKVVERLDEYDSLPDDGRIHFLLANAEIVRIKSSRTCTAAGSKNGCDGTYDWCEFADKHRGKIEPRLPQLFKREWDALVADETHKWLINTRGKKASQVGRGFVSLRTVEDGLRYAMTGTPYKGKKHNLWGTLNWLRPKVYTSKWNWVERYFAVSDNGYARTIGDVIPEREEALYRSLDAMCLRRTKAEIRAINPDWMPPEKIYHQVKVPMEPKQLSAYRAITKDASVKLKGGMLNANGVLAEFTRLKQFASCYGELRMGEFYPSLPSGKFEWLLEFLEERGIEPKDPHSKALHGDLSDEVHKVVIASQFTKNINLWASELRRRGIDCFVLTGEVTEKKRAQMTAEFQKSNTVRVFLINTMAGGVSITLDAADDVVIMDETWVPDDQLQVEDRVHRASNVKHQVHVWYVRAEESIEEKIAEANFAKAENNFVMLDARRGLEFASAQYGIEIGEED
jgi:SNF2 family DNA or RNA helicase